MSGTQRWHALRVRLNDVLDLARRRGLATPPLFLSVTLVRRVAHALAEHHAEHHAEHDVTAHTSAERTDAQATRDGLAAHSSAEPTDAHATRDGLPAHSSAEHAHATRDGLPAHSSAEHAHATRDGLAAHSSAEPTDAHATRDGLPAHSSAEHAHATRDDLAAHSSAEPGLRAPTAEKRTVQHATLGVSSTALDLSVDVDGTVRVLTSTDARADVADAALMLDRLMGEELDGELTRLIHAARRAEQPLRPDELEHRLGHWLVKQRQLFTGHDLVAEFRAWLVPDAAHPCDAQIATWLEGSCLVSPHATDVTRAAPSRVGKVVVGLAFLVMTLVGLLLLKAHEEREVFSPTDPQPIQLPPPPPVPTPAPLKLGGARYVPEAGLPRWLSGAPQRATLSSDVHGIDLTRAGVPLDLPGPVRWGLKVKVSPGQRLEYAALFVASLDHGTLEGVSVVGTRDWKWLDGSAARAFAVQPDLAPDEGSFGLLVARQFPDGRIEEVPSLSRAEVFGAAMAQQEGRRLVVDSLDPDVTYRVTLERTAAPLFVVASATTRRGDGRTMRADGFQAKGHPLDQVLLQPGVPIRVRQVRRLSFVVLTMPGQAEARAQVEIVSAATAPPRSPAAEAAAVGADEAAQALLKDGLRELAHGRAASAAQVFSHCLKVDPGNVDCEVNLQRALTLRR